MGHKVVEMAALYIRPLEGERKKMALATIVCQRYFWNWLVGMDMPVWDERSRLWKEAITTAEESGLTGDKATKKAAADMKGKWPDLPTKSLKSPVKKFFEWVATEESKAWVCGEKVPRRPLYAEFRKYKQTRDAASGFTSKGTVRKGGKTGRPKFRAWRMDKRASLSFQVQEGGGKAYIRKLIDRPNKRIRLPSLGWVKWRDKGRIVDEAIKYDARVDTIRLCRDGDDWKVALDVTYETEDRAPAPGKVGIDLGVTVPVSTSDDEEFGVEAMARIKKLEEVRKQVQRQLSRSFHAAAEEQGALTETGAIRKGARVKKSNRYKRLQEKSARISSRIMRIRKDWASQTSFSLTSRYGVVVCESLDVANMSRSAKGSETKPGRNVKAKSGLNREILTRGWTALTERLEHSLDKRGGRLVKVNPAYTSQTCRACGHVDPKNRKGVRFQCVSCGHTGHADHEAARNILDRAGL